MTPNQTYNQTIGAEDRALLRSIPSARRSESTDVCRPGSRSGFRAQASQSAFGPKRKTSGFGAAPQVSDLSNVTNVNIDRGASYQPGTRVPGWYETSRLGLRSAWKLRLKSAWKMSNLSALDFSQRRRMIGEWRAESSQEGVAIEISLPADFQPAVPGDSGNPRAQALGWDPSALQAA